MQCPFRHVAWTRRAGVPARSLRRVRAAPSCGFGRFRWKMRLSPAEALRVAVCLKREG